MEKTFITEGIILKSRDHHEYDRVFSVYTKDHGKLEIVGKGTKRILSKLNAHMSPLYYSRLMIAKGRRIDKLAGGNVINPFKQLQEDSSILGFTLLQYIAEISDSLIDGELQDERIFSALVETLELLDDEISSEVEHKKETLLWYVDLYTVKLLDYLGYRPNVYRCTNCYAGMLLPKNTFNLLSGGIVCEECTKVTFIQKYLHISDTGIKLIRLILEHGIREVAAMKLNKAAMDEVRDLIDKILVVHLDKRITSVQFFSHL